MDDWRDCVWNQGNLQHEYYTKGSRILLRHNISKELIYLMRHLKLCFYFSKKPYEAFMEHGGYTDDDVLVKKNKAKLMMPNFTIVRDTDMKCFLLLICGAISVKERLTAATGVPVLFHHVMTLEGVITDVISGHAHCGMAIAACWITEQSVPVLSEAIHQHPDYNIKVIGHSMGAGIASILTCMLREHKEFSSCTCIAFAPAACMTWELAESGKAFITTLVNRTDPVPSFSEVSAAQLHAEVTVSSWLTDLRDQIQHTRFLNHVNRSAAFLLSRVHPFVSQPHTTVVDADILATPNKVQNIADLIAGCSCSAFPDSESDSKSELDKMPMELLSDAERPQLFPPGRIMHMIDLPAPEWDFESGQPSANVDQLVDIYETPRELYGKIRLARGMIRDHCMPQYVRTSQMLINDSAKREQEDSL